MTEQSITDSDLKVLSQNGSVAGGGRSEDSIPLFAKQSVKSNEVGASETVYLDYNAMYSSPYDTKKDVKVKQGSGKSSSVPTAVTNTKKMKGKGKPKPKGDMKAEDVTVNGQRAVKDSDSNAKEVINGTGFKDDASKEAALAADMSERYPHMTEEEVKSVLGQLTIQADKLRDSTTGRDFRPVFSCVRPVVCHRTNTPFYAQCSTAKLGYCTWCRTLRRGNQKQGSICMNCGERLTAKYHKWYPDLVRLEPLEKIRTKETYEKHKPLFEKFGITWHEPKQLEFVLNNYMLMKIYVSHPHMEIEALHLERAYMIGVFAGREFNTGALARKLLREGCKLIMFRADFPDYFEFLRPERAAVAEKLNSMFFKGKHRCYFHAHHTNIEGWYDPSLLTRENIADNFKDLCNAVIQQSAKAGMNGQPRSLGTFQEMSPPRDDEEVKNEPNAPSHFPGEQPVLNVTNGQPVLVPSFSRTANPGNNFFMAVPRLQGPGPVTVPMSVGMPPGNFSQPNLKYGMGMHVPLVPVQFVNLPLAPMEQPQLDANGNPPLRPSPDAGFVQDPSHVPMSAMNRNPSHTTMAGGFVNEHQQHQQHPQHQAHQQQNFPNRQISSGTAQINHALGYRGPAQQFSQLPPQLSSSPRFFQPPLTNPPSTGGLSSVMPFSGLPSFVDTNTISPPISPQFNFGGGAPRSFRFPPGAGTITSPMGPNLSFSFVPNNQRTST